MSDTVKVNKKVSVNLEELLKNDAPYLVEDGKVNIEKLKGLLTGKTTEKEDDRFYFNWAGKDKVFQAIQAPAYSTLVPQKDKSIGWDDTENLMIVGENLETLKLLLKPYFGKVKVIYIDVPYNTGKDFIYKDDFSSPLKDYLVKTGQKDSNGVGLTTNTETNGRFHSAWLNSMYPRLFMARNLLKDNGLIFVSIDDNEVHHLRMIMDDIFGEDNFVDCLVWKKRYGGGSKEKHFVTLHEYILVYAKDIQTIEEITVPISDDTIQRYYKMRDENYTKRGPFRTHPLEATKSMGDRPNLVFPITAPDGSEINPKRQWLWSRETVEDALQHSELYFFQVDGIWNVHTKQYLKDRDGNIRPAKLQSVIDDVYTQHGTNEIIDIFGNAQMFPFPKPSELVKRLVVAHTQDTDMVMDFFAGSGTTGQAVYELNQKDSINRKFILVQIPEEIDKNTEAYKAGYKYISDICIDRLKKVSEKNNNELKYKVFKLAPSNFNLKDEFALTENKDLDELKAEYLKELGLYVNQPIVATAKPIDIVYEIILKNGFSLNAKIDEIKLGTSNFYHAVDTENNLEIYICLDSKVDDGSVEEVRTNTYKGKTFVYYDQSLTDSQKINLNTFVKLQVI